MWKICREQSVLSNNTSHDVNTYVSYRKFYRFHIIGTQKEHSCRRPGVTVEPSSLETRAWLGSHTDMNRFSFFSVMLPFLFLKQTRNCGCKNSELYLDDICFFIFFLATQWHQLSHMVVLFWKVWVNPQLWRWRRTQQALNLVGLFSANKVHSLLDRC